MACKASTIEAELADGKSSYVLSGWSLGAKLLLPSKIIVCIVWAQTSRLKESNRLRSEQLEEASKQVELCCVACQAFICHTTATGMLLMAISILTYHATAACG